jgi:hypothetical protein
MILPNITKLFFWCVIWFSKGSQKSCQNHCASLKGLALQQAPGLAKREETKDAQVGFGGRHGRRYAGRSFGC